MRSESHTPFLHRYHLREVKDHIKTGGNHIVGPFGTATLVFHNPDKDEPDEFEAQLTFSLDPGNFKPLAFYCEHEGFIVAWNAKPTDPYALEPPFLFEAYVKRVAQELAVRSLGSSYIKAKEAADDAYRVMVGDGFGDV